MYDDSGYDLSDPKHPTYHDRMVGLWDNRDETGGGLGGRDGRQSDTGEKTGSVLIERQEAANVPSAEPDSLHPPERERGAASTLPAYFPCGRARHGVFCRKPRGHSGRCDL